jgi:hypothetical protein
MATLKPAVTLNPYVILGEGRTDASTNKSSGEKIVFVDRPVGHRMTHRNRRFPRRETADIARLFPGHPETLDVLMNFRAVEERLRRRHHLIPAQ